jgi:hypothetical protein
MMAHHLHHHIHHALFIPMKGTKFVTESVKNAYGVTARQVRAWRRKSAPAPIVQVSERVEALASQTRTPKGGDVNNVVTAVLGERSSHPFRRRASMGSLQVRSLRTCFGGCAAGLMAGLALSSCSVASPQRVNFPLTVHKDKLLPLGDPNRKQGGYGEAIAVNWSPDGSRIAAASTYGGTLTVWNSSGHRLQEIPVVGGGPAYSGSIAFAGGGAVSPTATLLRLGA